MNDQPIAPAADPSDDEPFDELDEATDARIRAMLADLPDPGPMPEDIARRIQGAIDDEALLRIERGPLAGEAGVATGAGIPGSGEGSDHDVLVPLISRRRGPSPWLAVAAVAAAAAVVAVGGSALHVAKRPPDVINSIGQQSASTSLALPSDSPTDSGSPTPTGPATSPTVAPQPALGAHIQVSTTNYLAASLPGQARTLLATPAATLSPGAAESPTLGPIATEVGLGSCLAGLGVADFDAVSADLALYETRPAAIIVVTQAGASRVWAVDRACTVDAPNILRGALDVP